VKSSHGFKSGGGGSVVVLTWRKLTEDWDFLSKDWDFDQHFVFFLFPKVWNLRSLRSTLWNAGFGRAPMDLTNKHRDLTNFMGNMMESFG